MQHAARQADLIHTCLSASGLSFREGEKMKKWTSKPDVLIEVGTWEGSDDEPLTRWLNENGYAWRIQVDKNPVPKLIDVEGGWVEESDETEIRERLAVLGEDIWEHIVISKGSILALRENGRIQETNIDFLMANYNE